MAVTEDDAAATWAHYMNCEALATVERLAEILGCREDEVERKVERLIRWCLWP